MKKNNIFVKLLISILVFLTIVNFISSININMNYSFASDSGEERINELFDGSLSNIANATVNGIKWIILAPFRAARSLNYLLASSGGTTGGVQTTEISPFDIFFNRFTLLDANIFSTTDRDGNPLNTNGIVYKIRTNAAIWYYAIRTLAISIIAIMLIWNLVRAISKSTSSAQKVVAKNAITDWTLSFALVMFMHIIVIIVLNFNDLILSGIESFTPFANTSDFLDALENAVFSNNFVLGIAALIVYALFNWQTLKYILIYMQRMLTIVLLVMISPIVPVTYSTNRMKGGRGGALNSWAKELVFNVFIQVLHAMVYAALVGVTMSALTSKSSVTAFMDLGTAIIAVMSMLFIKYAEKLMKSLFGFDSSQILNTNVIGETINSVGNFATGVANLGYRATASRMIPPTASSVPFGQNVSDVGRTQTGNGMFSSLGNRVKTAGNNLMGGLRNNQNSNFRIGNFDRQNELSVSNSTNSTSSEDTNYLESSAYLLLEDKNLRSDESANRVGNKDIDNSNGAIEARNNDVDNSNGAIDVRHNGVDDANEVMNAGENSTGSANEAIETEIIPVGANNDYELKDKIDDLRNSLNEGNQESGDSKSENKIISAIEFINRKNRKNAEEDTGKNIEEHIENTKEHIETNTENTEHIEEKQEIITVGGDTSPEKINELKSGIEAIKNDNIEKLEKIAEELDGKLEEIGSKLSDDVKYDIESNVEKLINNPKNLNEYINSLPKDSNERKYAETYAKFNAVIDVSDNNITGDLSKEEKSQMLINTYKATGMKLPEKLSMDDVSKLEAVPENNEEVLENNETVPENNNSDSGNIVNIDVKRNNKSNNINNKNKNIVNETEQAYIKAKTELGNIGIKIENEDELNEMCKIIFEGENKNKILSPKFDSSVNNSNGNNKANNGEKNLPTNAMKSLENYYNLNNELEKINRTANENGYVYDATVKNSQGKNRNLKGNVNDIVKGLNDLKNSNKPNKSNDDLNIIDLNEVRESRKRRNTRKIG